MLIPDFKDAGIKVQSHFGEDSCFWLPIKKVDDYIEENFSQQEFGEIEQSVKSPIDRMQIYLNKKHSSQGKLTNRGRPLERILVVDDDHINLLILRKMFQKLGSFTVETAVNGLEAIKKI